MITRLQETYSPELLARIYAKPHDHRLYGRGHGERVEATIALGRRIPDVERAADLSCGNGAILIGIGAPRAIFGDLAPGYPVCGPIEDTVMQIGPVNLFVLSETLEHLDAPWDVLASIRSVTDNLLLSTPIDAWEDTNAEHYWAWSKADVEGMLTTAGFENVAFTQVDSTAYGEAYVYGIFWAR